MKHPFEIHFINGHSGDPAVAMELLQSGEIVLFDLGRLDLLAQRQLLKVKTALVSHTHIDHFIGFDRWLRVCIPHHRRLEVVGPPGITRNVHGKLLGYQWNLLEKEQVQTLVHELNLDGTVNTSLLCNSRDFDPVPAPEVSPTTWADIKTSFSVAKLSATLLDHGTPSVGYRLEFPGKWQVVSERLSQLQIEPGPWIGQLQSDLNNHLIQEDSVLVLNEREWRAAELAKEVFRRLPPQTVGYLTDWSFTAENFRRARDLLRPVDVLICESNFAAAERQRALGKKHLTTYQAALTATGCMADELAVFHVSKIYGDAAGSVVSEAQEAFGQLRLLGEAELSRRLEAEFAPPYCTRKTAQSPLKLGSDLGPRLKK